MKAKFIVLLALFCIYETLCFSQTPGLIFQSATGSGKAILDPNSDGYTSQNNLGFSVNDQLESEIPFIPLAFPQLEPTNDLNTGPGCGFTDFVDSGVEDPAMVRYDGTNLLFRLRLGNASNNSKGYSILIDTDQRFGFSGSNADPDASILNPGFEIEICLRTNFGVYVYDINSGCPVSASSSYPGNTNYQKSIALTTNCGNPDYFYDFFIPFSALENLGITASTPLRMAVVSQMNPLPAICNNALSDFGGVNDASCGGIPGTCFPQIINNFTPTSVTNMNSIIPDRSSCPIINTLLEGASTITGTTSEADGTLISVYKNSQLLNTTLSVSGSWQITGVTPSLMSGDTITATAIASGKSISLSDCSVKIIISVCSAPLSNSLTAECTPKKGFNGSAGSAVAGSIIKIYDTAGNLVIPNAGSIYNSGTITTNPDGSWVWKCNGNSSCSAGANNCISIGTYLITQTVSGMCESQPVIKCIGTSTASTTPTITGTLSTSTNSISGTSGNNALIIIYKRSGTTYTQIGETNASGTNWSISNVTLNACDTISTLAVQSGLCMSAFSSDKIVNNGNSFPPAITGNYCSTTNITSVNGTSVEAAGTLISIFENGVAEGSPAVVQANGTWVASTGINITPGSTITAKATAPCKLQSTSSEAVSTGVRTTDANLSITTSPVLEGIVSVSGNATSGNTVSLYVDQIQIGSPIVAVSGTWNTSGLTPYDLYTGGALTVTSTAPGGCAGMHSNSIAIQCVAPATNLTISNASDSICEGSQTSVQIDNSESNVIYQLYYDGIRTGSSVLGDGNNQIITSGNLNNPGYLKVKAIKIGGNDCESFFNDSMGVSTILPSDPIITATSLFKCDGDTVTLTSSYSSGIIWSTGESADEIQVISSGIYTVTFTDQYGCSASTNESIVFHPNPVQLSIIGPTSPGFCLGDSTLLTTTYIPDMEYRWKKYGNEIPNTDTTFYMVKTPGRYRVRITDNNGCSTISEYVEIVADLARPDIFASGSTVICQGGNAMLGTTPVTGINYTWKKYNNLIAGASGTTYQAGSAGRFSCVATNNYGCVRESDPVYITVSLPQPVISTLGDTNICYGDSILLNVAPEPGMTYHWKQHDKFVNGATGLGFFAKSTGQYKCVATDSLGCSNASNKIYISTNPEIFTITPGGATSFCPGGSVNLTVSATSGFSYQWRKYNVDIPGATGSDLFVTKTGRYKCIATDLNGCSRPSDAIDVVATCRLQNHPSSDASIVVIPNPSLDNFEIYFDNDSENVAAEVNIYDAKGKLVLLSKLNPNQSSLQVTGLGKGIYTAIIIKDDFISKIKLVRL